jgi:hypothetical protein
MTQLSPHFTVGMNLHGRSEHLTVDAEDALAAALRVKQQHPDAVITYVRKSNTRNDPNYPHLDAD